MGKWKLVAEESREVEPHEPEPISFVTLDGKERFEEEIKGGIKTIRKFEWER